MSEIAMPEIRGTLVVTQQRAFSLTGIALLLQC